MKRTILLSVLLVFGFFLSHCVLHADEPVKIIFDTDIGNDVDDTMAMAVIHALQNRQECELLAVTITKDHSYAAPMVDLLNRFYGRPDIPIGIVRDGVTQEDGKYLKPVYNTKNAEGLPAFPTKITPENSHQCPDAVQLLRKVLAEQEDQSVVIVQVGFSTNLARLLDSPGDQFSPLSGKELVKKKVPYFSLMAGAFVPQLDNYPEYNIIKDVPAAKKFFAECPCPVVLSGFEIGVAIQHPGVSMQKEYNYVAHHPVQVAYEHYRGLENDQPTFDLTSVLYVVRPYRNYFGLSEPMEVSVNDNGSVSYQPQENGRFRYMTVNEEQIATVREALCGLCSEPPQK